MNAGCPFPLQTLKGRGAGILSNPDKAKEVLEGINTANDVDFSIKMRLGNDDAEEYKAILPMLNEIRLTHITMHPRIGKQQYKGSVDMVQFKDFIEVCFIDNITIITGNNGIYPGC